MLIFEKTFQSFHNSYIIIDDDLDFLCQILSWLMPYSVEFALFHIYLLDFHG